MRCNNCGAEIMDGAPNCPNCGAPVIPSGGQNQFGSAMPAGKAANPAMEYFLKYGTIAGAALMIVGVIIPRFHSVKLSALGFEVFSAKYGLFYKNGGILKLWAVLLLIAAVGAIMTETNAQVKNIVKGLPFNQFYMPALGLIAFILAAVHKASVEVNLYGEKIVLDSDTRKLLGSDGGAVSYGLGISAWIVLIGLAILIAKAVIEFLNSNKQR